MDQFGDAFKSFPDKLCIAQSTFASGSYRNAAFWRKKKHPTFVFKFSSFSKSAEEFGCSETWKSFF